MSEPRRWKDSPDAPVGMQQLIRSAKRSHPLDEGTFRRGEGRIAKYSIAPAAIAMVSVWTKLAAAGAVGLAVVGAVVAVEVRREPPPPTSAVVAPAAPSRPALLVAPVEVEPAPTAEESVDPPAPTAAAPTAAAPTARTYAASNKLAAPIVMPPAEEPVARAKSSLSAELALLEDARSHLARDPEAALARLAEHRARHPGGLLAAERDLMELDALRRTGRVEDARDRARAWLVRDPNGIHAARIRAILGTLD